MNRTQQARRDAKQLFRMCLADGLLDEDRVRQVVQRISETKNRNRLKILAQFRRWVRLYCDRHAATIESAAPLPPTVQTRVQDGLSQRYGSGLNLSFTQSPALIGGMRIRVGDDLYDGSILGRLAALEARF